MNMSYKSGLRAALLMLFAFTLAACGKQEEAPVKLDPVAFHEADECHVCGMIIADFPGPKGQAVGRNEVKKFCSTAEMLSWWLQPENRILDARLYVHDMGQSHWDQPDDNHLIDAREAWYVSGTPLKGAMGASLASFADKEAAEALAAEHNGTVLQFDEIDQEFLQQAAAAQHGDLREMMQEGDMHDMGDMMQGDMH